MHEFLADSDAVMGLVKANDTSKFICLRQSLAYLAYLVIRAGPVLCYADLRAKLLEEYGAAVSQQDVYSWLEERRWKRGTEDLHSYVLIMENLARKHASIPEREVIDYVINGIGNDRHVAVLMGANMLADLKFRIVRYSKRFTSTKTAAAVRTDATGTVPNRLKKTQLTGPNERTLAAVCSDENRCFNCSLIGHPKPDCP